MYILSDKQLSHSEYLSYLPPDLRSKISLAPQSGLCEIRLRRQRPAVLRYTDGTYYLSNENGLTADRSRAYITDGSELVHTLENAFEFSLYAHEDELSNGYITIRGGHRIGLCGEAKNGKLRTISDISSLNFRIAHEHLGIAEPLKNDISDGRTVKSVLIISPPMCGKTSLLRDIVRMLSTQGCNVGVCDTRGEIAAMYDGTACMDIGDADILSGTSKSDGINMLLRTMSPDVIFCDEIGTKEDISAISDVAGRGIAVIATAHCLSREALSAHSSLSVISAKFNLIITLCGVGEIKEVFYA